MLKRCILRDTGLIKLMIFIGSSKTLCETGFFLSAMLAWEGRHGLIPPPRSVQRHQRF